MDPEGDFLWRPHWILYSNNKGFISHSFRYSAPGADPGFPVGGCADPRGGGAPTYDFVKIFEKLHEITPVKSATEPVTIDTMSTFNGPLLGSNNLWRIQVYVNAI